MKTILNSNQPNIDIVGICLGDRNWVPVVDALKSRSDIVSLALQDCKIGYEGLEAISRVAAECRFLRKLNLTGNEISDRGIELLLQLISRNESIADVGLARNMFTEAGISLLGRGLEVNRSLQVLNIESNGLDNDSLKLLARHLSKNSSMTDIYLGGNRLTYGEHFEIAKIMKGNSKLRLHGIGLLNRLGDQDDGQQTFWRGMSEKRSNHSSQRS